MKILFKKTGWFIRWQKSILFSVVVLVVLMLVTIFSTSTVYAFGQTATDFYNLARLGFNFISSAGSAGVAKATNTVFLLVGQMILSFFGLILYFAGLLLNFSIWFTIESMSSLVNEIAAIDVGWKILRDLVNISFIFVLLYVAISTILGQGGKTKKMVINVIVIALLINFSLFATKFVIDVSNIFALQFHNAIENISQQPNPDSLLEDDAWQQIGDHGLAGAIMRGLDMTTLNPQDEDNFAEAMAQIGTKGFPIIIMSAILILIVAFVFFAGALLLFSRFIALIFLMITSPLAVGSFMLPNLSKYGRDWAEKLINHAFFAPAFMLMMYLLVVFVNDSNFKETLYRLGDTPVTGNSFFGALVGGSFIVVINYVIIIGFAVAGLIIAKQMGIKGAEMTIKWGNSLRGSAQSLVGRNTVGRWSRGIADSEAFRGLREKHPEFGRLVQKPFDRAASAKFGGKYGYDQVTEQKEKEYRAFGKQFEKNPERLAGYINNLSEATRQKFYEDMSPKMRAETERAAQKVAERTENTELVDTIRKMKDSLSLEDQQKVDKEIKEADKKQRQKNAIDTINAITGLDVERPVDESGVAIFQDVAEALRELPRQQARALSREALANPEVVARLSPGHLSDIMKNKEDLRDEDIEEIVNIISNSPYPNETVRNQQIEYINNPNVSWFWGTAENPAEPQEGTQNNDGPDMDDVVGQAQNQAGL